jgi:hypothetical protein
MSLNLSIHPEWTFIQAAIVEALEPYPQAKGAVTMKLLQIEGGVVNGHG